MKTIDQLIKNISYITAFALFLLTMLIAYDALMSYFFSTGSIALQELEWHLFDMLILLSIAYTFKMKEHVKIDIFYENFSQKWQKRIDLLSIIFLILPFSFVIIYFGYDFVMLSFTQNEASSDPGGLSYRFIVKSLMILGFVLVILQNIVDLAELIKEKK